MNLNVIVNKYLLMWNILYQSSPSEEIDAFKQKLWFNYKREYSLLHKDKADILQDIDNYIPDDDTVYNVLESSSLYNRLKQETNRYRLTIMEIWDRNSKNYMKEIRNIMKYEPKEDYLICAVHPNLDILEADFKHNIITVGKKLTINDKDNFLTYLLYRIFKNELSKIKTTVPEILEIVLELAITNELYTRNTGESKYYLGKKNLRKLKQKIYPYWLMYLGVPKEQFEEYMVRDNIFFNIEDYDYEMYLKSADIYSFIEYLVKNKRQIISKRTPAVEDIEVL